MVDQNSAFNNLTLLVQVIGANPKLTEWFSSLSMRSAVERREEIHAIVETMRVRGEEADIVSCFAMLAEDSVYEAACVALRECGYMDE